MKSFFRAALAISMVAFASNTSAETFVGADVVADATWCNAVNTGPIILEKPVFVKSGATLTILPGCVVRGQPRTAAVLAGSTVGTPGALIVTQNGRIIADANESNPIVMTTAAIDNDNDGVADDVDGNGFDDPYTAGDTFLDDTPTTAPLAPIDKDGFSNVSKWGGLVINGNAPTNLANKCGAGFGKCTIEGLTVPGFDPADATYGGDSPHDNSGVLRYVSVRHAGDEIGSANELNGISLGAVGDATVIENVEVYANFDDGIEWFGGTVNGSKLHVVFAGDDTFDLDQGYTGINQFLFGIMPFFNELAGGAFGSASGDRAGEFDGDDFGERGGDVAIRADVSGSPLDTTCWPITKAEVWNATIIGTTLDGANDYVPTGAEAASDNRGFFARNGYAGRIFNSIVVNTGSRKGYEIDDDTGDGCPGLDTIDHVNDGTVALVSSTLDDSAAMGAAETTAIANGDAIAADQGGGVNFVNNLFFNGLENEDVTFDPSGNSAGKLDSTLKTSKINPRPKFALNGVIGGTPPQGAPLENVTYRGAFDRVATKLWTTNWTVLSIAGLIED